MDASAPMQRVLVIGASGFLGRYIALHLKTQQRVMGSYHAHPIPLAGCASTPLDIMDERGVRATFETFHPHVVIHTAALGDVDQCEANPDAAYRVNVQGTEHVARAAAAVGARLIHISTDQIYDGSRAGCDEADEPRPLMVYGRTKLEGERRAAAICGDTVILRLALLYGWGSIVRPSFSDWLEKGLREGREVPLFIDQYRTPLFVEQGAEVIGQLLQEPGIRGVFNLGGGERISRYAFGLKFCDMFALPTEQLKPIAMDSLGQRARRPRDSVRCCTSGR
ncbi:MAG: SDR family oxidoreductase [Nitrospinae bacterium]|nr:SDR family oxidoreductase [Nitrospinota bacterium]